MTAPVYRYRSPLRPLDYGYMRTALGDVAEPAWDATDIGPWTPATVYAFKSALSARVIDQWSLEVLP